MDERSRAEDWLTLLLWGVDFLTRPTIHKATETYESWRWRQRMFDLHFHRLHRRQLVHRQSQGSRVVYRLTELGRLAALGGRDPQSRWDRSWDGRWRMVVFDLPLSQQVIRQRFLRWLRQNGFGYLQDSVWIHTDPVHELTEALKDFHNDVEALTVLEAQCCAGYSNAALVNGAWPFEEINRRYATHQQWLEKSVPALLRHPTATAVAEWLHQERVAWRRVFSLDPLLPRSLWPPDYRGEQVLAARRRAFAQIGAEVFSG